MGLEIEGMGDDGVVVVVGGKCGRLGGEVVDSDVVWVLWG